MLFCLLQWNLKKNCLQRLWRLVFPMLFGPSDGPPPWGGCKRWGITWGGAGVLMPPGRMGAVSVRFWTRELPTDTAGGGIKLGFPGLR